MEDHKYKVIVANEKGEVKEEEIKRVIDLLKDESSDQISILEDLNVLLDSRLIFSFKKICIETNILFITTIIKENSSYTYFEPYFLGSVSKIFEFKKNDEKILNLLAIIVIKIFDDDYNRTSETFQDKIMNAVSRLYDIMITWYNDSKTKEGAIKSIITISKKYPSDVINNNNIKDNYKNLLSLNKKYSDEQKKSIFILFEEIIKEGIIKKGEEGSEMIEEILYIAEMTNNKKDIYDIKEELINEINNYILNAKEKGFESKVWKNKNDILSEDIYINWIELCKSKDNINNSKKDELMKKEDKEKIKKFCCYVSSQSFDIQIIFIYKLLNILNVGNYSSDEYKSINSRKNGLLLYLYLPLLFKIYHLEEILPLFINEIGDKYKDIPKCYEYIIKLYNEIIERMMIEEKEIEINEENIIIIIFLWSVRIEEGKKENEIEYLIKSTVKVLEWLGRIEEEKELIKKKDKKEEGVIININRKESFICKLLDIFAENLSKSKENKKKVKKEGRIGELLLEIVKNHLKIKRNLLQKGNKKNIIEHIIYSYNSDVDTSNLLSFSSPSFPFSDKTILHILDNIFISFIDDNVYELIKEIFIYVIEELYNYMNITKIISECDIKKEIEKELLIDWNNYIINDLFEKISLNWRSINGILCFCFHSISLFLFSNANYKKLKKILCFFFSHNNYNLNNNEKEKEKNNKNINKMFLLKPFIIDKEIRQKFVVNFISHITDEDNYSLLNTYYLIRSEECSIINIYMKELSGEIVDRIKEEERINIMEERRRYERERIDDYSVIYCILSSLSDITEYTYKDRNNVYLGDKRNKEEYKGKEKEIKEIKDYISDIIEEEDVRECLILYLRLMRDRFNYETDTKELMLSNISICSNNALYYLLSINEIKS